MKKIAFALTALGLAAGVAQADSFRETMDRHDNAPVFATADQTVELPAGRVYGSKDLVNMNLSPNDKVTVTRFPSSGVIDAPSRN